MKIFSTTLGVLGANCYILMDEDRGESALIDPGGGKGLSEFIEQCGASVTKIMLTHRHFDHIGGTRAALDLTGGEVIISEKDASALYDPCVSRAQSFGAEQEPVREYTAAKDGDVIMIGDISVKVMETPGHTSGSVCYIAEDVIFSGDTLFYGTVGAMHFPTGSESDMTDSLRRIFSLQKDYRVLPGHGRDTTLKFEREHNQFVRMALK